MRCRPSRHSRQSRSWPRWAGTHSGQAGLPARDSSISRGWGIHPFAPFEEAWPAPLGSGRVCLWWNAQGIQYETSIVTGWKPPLKYRLIPPDIQQELRNVLHIVCDGQDIPPAIPNFAGEVKHGPKHALASR